MNDLITNHTAAEKGSVFRDTLDTNGRTLIRISVLVFEYEGTLPTAERFWRGNSAWLPQYWHTVDWQDPRDAAYGSWTQSAPIPLPSLMVDSLVRARFVSFVQDPRLWPALGELAHRWDSTYRITRGEVTDVAAHIDDLKKRLAERSAATVAAEHWVSDQELEGVFFPPSRAPLDKLSPADQRVAEKRLVKAYGNVKGRMQ